MKPTAGFFGRRRQQDPALPPGQHLTHDFPVLSAGPAPRVPTKAWEFEVAGPAGQSRSWTWSEFTSMPAEDVTVDIHCVTSWSKLNTHWRGVPVEALLDGAGEPGTYAMVHSYGGYTTNIPVEDLLDGRAWIVYEYEGEPLEIQHGGPARLLVPHLYFWKSAKWVRAIRTSDVNEAGFWELAGYHDYGDPWLEQRYWGD